MQTEVTNEDNVLDYRYFFDVLKTKVNPQKKTWDIYVKPKKLFNSKEQALIEEKFEKLYDLNKVRIICENPQSPEEIFGIIKTNWRQIVESILLESPSLTAFINDSDIRHNNGLITVFLDRPGGEDYLKEKKFENILEDTLYKHYNLSMKDLRLCYLCKNSADKKDKELLDEESRIIYDVLKNNTKKNEANGKNNDCIILGKLINDKNMINIEEINDESGRVTIEGIVFHLESRLLNNGNEAINFYITDHTDSVICKLFIKEEKTSEVISKRLLVGTSVRVKGNVQFDSYSKCAVLYPNSINEISCKKRIDTSKEKRVELHAHTNMSALDGIASVTDLVKRAKEWGHKAVAITDHGVVQAFPDAYEASKRYGIKVIYGVEGYLVNDEIPIVYGESDFNFDDEFVVFDIETTGLSSVNDKITEIGAVVIKNKQIIKKYNSLINPEIPIPDKITKLTGINNQMVAKERTIKEVLPEFLSFIGDRPLIAHNALFDWGFIKNKANKLGYEIRNVVIDTLQMSRSLLPIKKHKLNNLCDYFNIKLLNHHRAQDDSEATARIVIEMFRILESKDIANTSKINSIVRKSNNKFSETYHVIILVKNQKGLYNLYKLISKSHIDYFYKKPRILRSLLEECKDGLIIGSACESGEIFKLLLNEIDRNKLINQAKLYDFFEVQPLANNQFLIDNGTIDKNKLIKINKRIIALAAELRKPAVATGDVHFIDPEDEIFRRILMSGQGYKDADNQAPLYFKTTDEMLKDFDYLSDEEAFELVITNPNKIADLIEDVIPIPEETFPPKIEGSEDKIWEMTYDKAHDIYGKNLPDVVKERLDKELNSIINNGYAVMYLIAHKLVTKSLEDGYLVGSRGSVGSSLVATMCNITEVNPLPPHYICKSCKWSHFYTDNSFGSGADLPDKICPDCGEPLTKDGHDIPFEVFLGFEGNKEPDIDLNFAGEYQPEAHKFTEKIFGKGQVFRAGTIGTVQDKSAYGFVKKYYEEKEKIINAAEIKRLVSGCTGVKRTTGQHPGGVMIVPQDHEIYEFTPIQRPADDADSSVITTHFDYHSISGRLLKLDILGHDVPSIIKMLEDITGFNAKQIRFDNKEIMSLFTSTDALGISLDDIDCKTGTLGIPEFGTKFVRQMLMDTKPSTFAELVRISGLSHGTDVWLNNAQDLIRNDTATLKDVISTRDDIMLFLIYKGLKPKLAFEIAEGVRKGKGLKEEFILEMKKHDIPDWYINSCKLIKYLFPKAHATAYVMMSFRIAHYKIYYPEAFYASYFTARIDDFDTDLFIKGKDYLKKKWNELNNKGNNVTAKEKNLMSVLEVIIEMYCRNICLLPVDLYKSAADVFKITESGILPPLRSLQGLGINAAMCIVKERDIAPFFSIEDLRERTKITKTVVDILKNHGCINGLPEGNQLTLF